MEIFDFDNAWEFLKEDRLIKRLLWKDGDILGMRKGKLYKLIPWIISKEDLNADDWTVIHDD